MNFRCSLQHINQNNTYILYFYPVKTLTKQQSLGGVYSESGFIQLESLLHATYHHYPLLRHKVQGKLDLDLVQSDSIISGQQLYLVI